MKNLLVLILFLISFQGFSQRLTQVKSVYDGDSYYVTISGIFTEIRLINADSPEVFNKYTGKEAQPFADSAKSYVKKLILKKTVKVRLYGKDKYKRTLAEVYVVVNGRYRSLSRLLIEKGLAWVNSEYVTNPDKLRILNSVQNKAKSKKIGLWSDANPTEPKLWRKQ